MRARRLHGGDVEVSGWSDDPGVQTGWRYVVGVSDRSLRVIPPAGERVSSSTWKSIPVGAIMRAADELLADDRADSAVAAVPKLGRRWTDEQRDEQIAAAYRQAVLASVAPRTVVARLLAVGEDRAGREITRLRAAGLIESIHEERRRAAEEAAR